MLYFQFSYVADRATQGTDAEMRLLSLYANFRGWLNVAVLALQLFGTARLFRRIGVPLAATLSPLIYLVGFLGMAVRLNLGRRRRHGRRHPAGSRCLRPGAAGSGDALSRAPTASGYDPDRGPQRAGGVSRQLALVLITIALASPAWVGVAGLPIVALWAATALVLWRIYPTLLLEVATARRLRSEEAPLNELIDAATQRALATSLVDPDPQRARAARALVMVGPVGPAVAALAGAALGAAPPLLESLHTVLDRATRRDRRRRAADDLKPLLTTRLQRRCRAPTR